MDKAVCNKIAFRLTYVELSPTPQVFSVLQSLIFCVILPIGLFYRPPIQMFCFSHCNLYGIISGSSVTTVFSTVPARHQTTDKQSYQLSGEHSAALSSEGKGHFCYINSDMAMLCYSMSSCSKWPKKINTARCKCDTRTIFSEFHIFCPATHNVCLCR